MVSMSTKLNLWKTDLQVAEHLVVTTADQKLVVTHPIEVTQEVAIPTTEVTEVIPTTTEVPDTKILN